jgi:hypothetical protein
MPICKECNTKFPNKKIIEGKERCLHTRKYCLDCSPFNSRKKCGPKKSNKKGKDPVSIMSNCKICERDFFTKTFQKQCPACKSKKQRHEKKEKAIKYLGSECKACGYKKCSQAFDFHHVDPNEKELTLSGNWEKSWNTIEKEIKKCILLCCRCHRELHAGMITLE